jgi:nickel-dependent lactate racemase
VEIARSRDPREGAVIVVSDITRPVPNKPILEGVLSTLQDSGYDESSITILVATGMHRPTTDEEKAEMLGEEIPRRFRIVDHKADRRDELVELPEPTSAGSRVLVNKLYMQAGLKILTGFIEPHFMAGYSGGRKSICPGISNLETIQKFHGPGFLEDPGANFGILDGNPCHRESLDVARQAGADFVVNVAIDTDKRILGVYAGDLEAAHEAGVADVERMVGVDVDDQYDIVITCGGGYPLDSTYYQAVKGMCFALPFLKEGGILVEASECCEGVGSDIYEQLMVRFSGEWEHFLETIRQSDDVIKDQWEFEVQCRVLRHTGVERLIFLTDGIETERLAHFCVTPAQRLVGEGDSQDVMDRLVKYLHAEHPDASWAVVPVGPYLLPRVGAMATI